MSSAAVMVDSALGTMGLVNRTRVVTAGMMRTAFLEVNFSGRFSEDRRLLRPEGWTLDSLSDERCGSTPLSAGSPCRGCSRLIENGTPLGK